MEAAPSLVVRPHVSRVPLLPVTAVRRAGGLLMVVMLGLRVHAQSLHEKIDAAMDAARVGPEAPAADDATFLRRAGLALTGMPPSADEARAFLSDAAPDKRAKLIARLTASRECIHHLTVQLDVMLMERRAEMHTKAADWRRWLEDSLTAGKTWDQLVREMLAADGSDEKSRHVARWMLERQAEPNLLTRDAGRLFLGSDLACAQCHDHPRVDDYTQRDYHGLAAFFGRTSLFQPDAAKPALVAEQATGETAWTSVFTKISGTTKPHLPGAAEISEPVIAGGELWSVAPNEKDKNVRPVPKQSRRGLLGDALVNDPAFRRNMANRVWGMVMGRCLVEPPDYLHSANPPVHPAVLEAAAEGLAGLKFDLRPFMQELALTKTFAAAFDPAPPQAADREQLKARVTEMDEAAGKLKVESGRLGVAFTESVEALEEEHHAAQPALDAFAKASAAHAEAGKAVAAADAECKKSEAAIAELMETARLLREAAAAGDAAGKASPEDKELEAAAKTFHDKLAKTETDTAAAGKDLAAKKDAAAAKAKEAEAALAAAEAKKPAADAVREKIAAAEKKRDAADAAKRTSRVAALQAEQRLREARAVMVFANAAETAAPFQAECERTRAAVTALEQSIADRKAAIGAGLEAMPALEKQVTESAAALMPAKQAMEAAAAQWNVLNEASGKAAAVITRLPQDAGLQTAAKTLQARAEQAVKTREAAQKSLTERETAAASAAAALTAGKAALENARTGLAAAEQSLPAALAARTEAEAKAAAALSELAAARQSLAATGSTTFSLTSLSALPPEALCWSILRVTGTLDQLRESAAKEWDEKNKPSDADKADPAKQAVRAAAVESLTLEKVKPHEEQFVRLFANSAGQPQNDFFATADQVLYFENAGAVRNWTGPGGNNLTARLTKLPDAGAVAEELYLNVLTRLPSAEETADIAALLSARPPEQKNAAISDAVWALLTSTEFRFRH